MPFPCPTCSVSNPDDSATCLRCGRVLGRTMAKPAEADDSSVTVAAGRPAASALAGREGAAPLPAAAMTITDVPRRKPSDTPPPSGPAPAPMTLRDGVRREPTTVSNRVGDSAVRSDVRPAPAAPAATFVGTVKLVVVRGEQPGAEYAVLDGKNYIGRSADRPVDIDLDGQEPLERIWTSRQHAVVTREAGVVVVEDLNSLNGTFVNRVRIHPGHPKALVPGDVIQIGTVQMKVVG